MPQQTYNRSYRGSLQIIFTHNLKSARAIKGWTQQTAASLLGLKRSTYQAYEEGRAWPPAYGLIRLADVFGIKDLLAFLTSDNFKVCVEPGKGSDAVLPTLLQLKYDEAGTKEKQAVNILLGLVDIE